MKYISNCGEFSMTHRLYFLRMEVYSQAIAISYIEEEKTTEKVLKTNNDLQNIDIKLKI